MNRIGVIAALSVVALLASVSGAGGAGVPPQLSEAESRALARAATERALAEFAPPPGAVPSASEPPGQTGPGPFTFGPANLVTLRRWWVISASPGQAISFVAAHPPAGAQQVGSGNFEGSPAKPGVPTLPTDIDFDWPAVARARGSIRLSASATRLGSGATALEVSSTAFWLTPRASTEAVAPGSTLLKISVFPYRFGPALRTKQRRLSITSRSRIERVATLVNALPLAQPVGGVRSCPAPRGVVLRLAFYRSSRGRPVAVVRDNLVSCGDVELALNGHGEPSLEEGWELPEQVSEAIGVRLDTRFTEPHGR